MSIDSPHDFMVPQSSHLSGWLIVLRSRETQSFENSRDVSHCEVIMELQTWKKRRKEVSRGSEYVGGRVSGRELEGKQIVFWQNHELTEKLWEVKNE